MSNITSPSNLLGAEEIILVTGIYRITGALWIVPLCLVFYDFVLTFEAEVQYFWSTQGGTLTRVLFFVNRYWPAGNLVHAVPYNNVTIFIDLSLISSKFATPGARIVGRYTAYSAGAQHLIVGGILTIRIYAMFKCNKKLLVVLLTLYALWIGSETILIGLVTSRFKSNEALRDIFTGCAPTNIPTWCYIYWLPSLAFESLLLILACWKTIQEASSSFWTSKIMVVLLRDSVLYFGGVTLFTIANFLAWYIAPLPLYGMFIA
ncbi:hypothetical protein M422DRAFT_782536 [Sphaerobolus stellatus SS14]|uniref:DUF6533 domain-containing protein n=1 Tax=Sphaerobolus stellatus (strain SS14) TaxID=990650 RepID=A0A0C9TYH8_SPHS4|nr:hypothetical protein M422DRAFT_782536 [Sphaerobolus stellatus SS14]